MNRGLVLRFIEASTLMLAPITPHTSEHVWRHLLQRPGSVLTAGWPAAAEPDLVMQQAAKYIEDIIPSLRKLIIKVEAPPKKKKGGGEPAETVKVRRIAVCDLCMCWALAMVRWLRRAVFNWLTTLCSAPAHTHA